MRVIIYVPESRSAARTRRAIRREVLAQGHEIVGSTCIGVEALTAVRTGVADRIAGRPDHLIELADDWALPVTPRPTYRALGAIAAPFQRRAATYLMSDVRVLVADLTAHRR